MVTFFVETSGIKQSASKVVNVLSLPAIDVHDISIFKDSVANLTTAVKPLENVILSFYEDSGGIVDVPNPAEVSGITTNTTFYVKARDALTNCESNLEQFEVNVNTLPTATISTGNVSICPGDIVGIEFYLTGIAPWKLTYSEGGYNTTITTNNPAYTINVKPYVTTTYELISITDANYTATASGSVTISVSPLPEILIAGAGNLCESSGITLTASPVGGTWLSHNPTVATVNSAGVISGLSAGRAEIQYTAVNVQGCSNSAGAIVTVNPLPVVSITGNNNLCLNNTTQLTGFPAGGTWKSIYTSVATVNSTGLVTAISPGTAEIRYIAHSAEGCTDSISKMITINPLPFPDFSFTGIVYGQTTTFNNTTPGSITSYNWDFGDGGTSTEASPSHIYNAAGSYRVKLEATNSHGCTDSIIKTVIIDKAQLAVTVDAGQQKVFGQPDPLAYTYSTTGWQYSDGDFLLTGKLERVPGDNVGTYNILQGNLSAGSNYTIDFTGNHFEITKATLSVTANVGQNKVYGQPDPPAYTFSATGWQYSDGDFLLTGKLERVPGDNVGTYNILQGNLSAGSNYTIDFTGNHFEITKATLSVTANVGQNKVFGQPDPPAYTFSATGWQYSDGESLLTGKLERVPGDNVGTYNILQGNLSAGTNYTIDFTGSNFEITKATLSVTANVGQSKVYGQPDPILNYQLTNGQLFGTDSLIGNLSRTPGEDAGNYPIILGSLTVNDGNNGLNYEIKFIPADFEIIKATQTISFNALPDVYSNASPFILTAVSSSGLPVSYTSSNTDAASVTPDGKVTIHSIGETTITASQPGNNNYHAAADVQQTLKVLPVEAASIAIYPQESRIRIGETIQLHATIQPPNTTDKTINWSSSNTDIANVDANGLITGKAYGTVTITATTSNGLRATATIHVHTIDIKDDVKPSQGFSPDGDGENDYWIVDGIEKHPKNDLYIFDRGGKLHYSVKNYKNNWDGIANVGPYKGRKVPPGTYYYVLKIDDVHMKRSFIVIKY